MTEFLFEKVLACQSGDPESALYFVDKFAPLLKHYAFLLKDEDAFYELQCKLLEVLKGFKKCNLRSCSDGAIVKYIQQAVKNEYIQLARKDVCNKKVAGFDDLSPYEEAEYEIKCSTNEHYETLLLNDLKNILTSTEYDIIYLLFFQNYTVREVSEASGKTRQAINEMKLTALTKLRRKLL